MPSTNINKNKDFLSLVLEQLVNIKLTQEFKEKTNSLFNIFPLSARESLTTIESELHHISNSKNKEFLEKKLSEHWFLLWNQNDFLKSDIPYFEKYYLGYSDSQKKELNGFMDKYKITPKTLSKHSTPEVIISLPEALSQYKKLNLAPLSEYLNTTSYFNINDTKKILTTLDTASLDIDSDMLAAIMRKGDNVALGKYFTGRAHKIRINKELLFLPPKDYIEARQIMIESINEEKNTKRTVLDIEIFTELFYEDKGINYLLNILLYTINDYYARNPTDCKINQNKYYNALSNFEFSFEQGDLPILEEKMKKLCGKNNIKDYKKNVVENLLTLMSESPAKTLKTLKNQYSTLISAKEMLDSINSLNQIYIDKKNLTKVLGSIPNNKNSQPKKLIKI